MPVSGRENKEVSIQEESTGEKGTINFTGSELLDCFSFSIDSHPQRCKCEAQSFSLQCQ